MNIEKNQIVNLMIATTKVVRQCDKLDAAIENEVFLELFEIDMLTETILDLCGVPVEEMPFEILGIDTSDMNRSQIEYGFCRDRIQDMLYEIETRKYKDENELKLACDVFIIGLLDQWMPDEQYITKRTDE